jgi:hypothetical protein
MDEDVGSEGNNAGVAVDPTLDGQKMELDS